MTEAIFQNREHVDRLAASEEEERQASRVLFVTPRFPPPPDGLGDHVFRLASALNLDPPVFVLTGREGTRRPRVEVVRAQEGPGSFEVLRWVRGWGVDGPLALARALRRSRASLVHLHYVPHGFGRYGFAPAVALFPLIARAFGARTLVTVHEFAPEGTRAIGAWIQAHALRVQGRVLLALSNATSVAASSLLPSRRGEIAVTPGGPTVEPVALDRTAARERLRAAGIAPPAWRFVLASAATAHPGRRYGAAVEAVRALRRRGRAIGLLLVGDGFGPRHPDFGCVTALAADGGAATTGAVDGETYSLCLRAADLFAHFHEDGATERSTSLANALAHALPCVIGRGRAAAPELLDGCGGITLVPWGDAEATASAIERFLEDEGSRDRAGAAVAALAADRFSWPAIADRYREIYECLRPR